MTHTIRLALADDYPAICEYLEAHWRKGHIFTKSKALFDWQHWSARLERYNFVLGCADNGDIHGVFGFIPNGQWDAELGYDSIWLAIWSTCEAARGQGLGRRLLSFIEDTYQPTFIGTNGASDMTLRIYEERGYVTGSLEHWYMTWPFSVDTPRLTVLNKVDVLPSKSHNYLEARYDQHPFYRYDRIMVGSSGIVTRVCKSSRSCGLRVVDVIGDENVLRDFEWRALATEAGSSWVDIYCAGLDSVALRRAGFFLRRGNEMIIPGHFEPYEHKNVEINYAVKCAKPWRILRGDSDMDRPNVLPC